MVHFPRLRARNPEVPLRRLVPNALTTIALCCGLASLHFSLKADWDKALVAIAIAAVFDLLDGRAARLLRATSRFGAVLDSLADFLSFGVAPAMLLHEWLLKSDDLFGLAAVMTFVLCSALRLARFTAAAYGPTPLVAATAPPTPAALAASKFFVGMPTPAAAGAVLIPAMIHISPATKLQLDEWAVVLHTFVVSGLMVSRVPMWSLKRIRIKREHAVPLMVGIGLLVVLIAKSPWLTAAGLASGYLLTIPWSFLAHRRLVRVDEDAAPVEPAEPESARRA